MQVMQPLLGTTAPPGATSSYARLRMQQRRRNPQPSATRRRPPRSLTQTSNFQKHRTGAVFRQEGSSRSLELMPPDRSHPSILSCNICKPNRIIVIILKNREGSHCRACRSILQGILPYAASLPR